MLVLTRKTNQSITMGKDIRLTILSIEGDRVSVGIDAPQEVRIFRSELIEDTLRANRESQGSAFFSQAAFKKSRDTDAGKQNKR
ncbi:MAG: carbon storage regulator [Oscillospiraceae bacterium]|nr:carbon storage regulator [Oscillospiraceae bacterium]